MGKIFEGQSALRIECRCSVDITGALATLIKYTKPSGASGSFVATVQDALQGIIYYDVVTTSEIDEDGVWLMWSHVTFSDGRIAQGIPIKVCVNAEGEII